MSETSIDVRLTEVKQRIADACVRFNRSTDDVNLLAVSKTKPISGIEAAIAGGQLDFGENYLQEALDKIRAISQRVSWHYIGAIQSNKTRPIAEHFDWVHTVASEKVLNRLADQRPTALGALKVLVQVNISDEESKAGVHPEMVAPLARAALSHKSLEFRGLMAIPAPSEDFERQRAAFARLRDLRKQVEAELGVPLPDLSMGMTGDLEAAVAEGATWLRIGTAIFGARG